MKVTNPNILGAPVIQGPLKSSQLSNRGDARIWLVRIKPQMFLPKPQISLSCILFILDVTYNMVSELWWTWNWCILNIIERQTEFHTFKVWTHQKSVLGQALKFPLPKNHPCIVPITQPPCAAVVGYQTFQYTSDTLFLHLVKMTYYSNNYLNERI